MLSFAILYCFWYFLQNLFVFKVFRNLPEQEKVGIEGEDYTLHYYKRKIGSRGFLKINVTEYGEPLSKNEITIGINGINILGKEEPSYYLDVNKKYNFYIMGVGAGKYLYINNVKVREGDSIILNVHLKDTLWIE